MYLPFAYFFSQLHQLPTIEVPLVDSGRCANPGPDPLLAVFA